jgi:O-methyltransferase domain
VQHDFFQPEPIKGAQIYFMRYIIHDWPDADALRILGNVRDAMSSESRLLVCDRIIMPTYRSHADGGNDVAPKPLLANWADSSTSGADLLMMNNFNAKERTKDEFKVLIEKAGLSLRKIWFQNGAVGILEIVRSEGK